MNAPIIKEEVSLRSIKHEIYTITNNKIALCKLNDKETLDDGRVTTYPLESNIPFMKYFDDKIMHKQGLF